MAANRSYCYSLLLLVLLMVSPLAVQAEMLALSWDNDITFSTDGNYTNGIKLTWHSDEQLPLARQVTRALHFLPGWGNGGEHRSLAVNIEQLMLTPEDISRPQPQFDDTPYAGLLQAEVWGIVRNQDYVTGYGIGTGVTGRASLVESGQKLMHRWTGSEEPQGWDYQLPQKHTVAVSAMHARRWNAHRLGNLDAELGWGVGSQLGNWLTEVSTGVFYTFGRNLPGNIMPSYSVFSTPVSLAGLFSRHDSGWAVYLGLGTQFPLYSYLESEGRKAGYYTDAKDNLGIGFAGITVYAQGLLVSFSGQRTTSLTKQGDKPLFYGNFSLGWLY